MAETSTLISSGAHEDGCCPNFNPTRLELARKRRGYTKTELAEKLGLSLRAVSSYESGEAAPSLETFVKIQSALGFSAAFFEGDNLDEPHVLAVSFRSLTKMSAKLRDMALSQGAFAVHLNKWLEGIFELPAPDLPDLSAETDPEVAADFLRQAWGIGQQPVKNMVHLLESKGVRVFSIAVDSRNVDAFSTWKGNTPFVFLNRYKSAEHSRFDAAHELCHLTMHQHGDPKGRNAEIEANKFASAFLMPRAGVLAHLPKFPTLPEMRRLKKIWTTSMAAMCHRLHELHVISDWHYKMLFVEMSKRGYRVSEPDGVARETSLVLPKLLSSLYQQDKMTRSAIADKLGLPLADLEDLLFSLVMTGVNGGRANNKAGNPALLTRVK
jgi:Zn-dependent peptidase ImmA (M78 family)/transcriptional regulator with XRE-family HTH domain